MLLAYGLVCGLLSAKTTGEGQVVDAAMVDGAAVLTTMFHAFRAMGIWNDERGTNLLDSGAPFYDCYETSDGKHMAVGALEPQFFMGLLMGLGIDPGSVPLQFDPSGWPVLRERLAVAFRTRTRDEWEQVFSSMDACVAPVLTMEEAARHPHNAARGTFLEVGGITQPAPAPRFGRTPAAVPAPPVAPGAHTDQILAESGYTEEEIAALRSAQAAG